MKYTDYNHQAQKDAKSTACNNVKTTMIQCRVECQEQKYFCLIEINVTSLHALLLKVKLAHLPWALLIYLLLKSSQLISATQWGWIDCDAKYAAKLRCVPKERTQSIPNCQCMSI